MLSIFDGVQPMSRRQMLTVGGLGLGGLTLPLLWAGRAQGTLQAADTVKDRSVIFIFQQGGPSQFETFDPKPDAPQGIRTVTDVVSTSLPGVAFAEPMSRLAPLAHKLTILRSFQTHNNGHNSQPLVGPDSRETHLGVHFSRVAGSTRAETGIPTGAVVYPQSVDPSVPKPQHRGNLLSTGGYGGAYAPFVPGGGGQLEKDMVVSLPHERFFQDRRELLKQLDRLRRETDQHGRMETLDELQQQSYQLLLGGGVSKALDLSQEDPQTLALYDTSSHAAGASRWNKVNRGRAGYYTAQAKTIGHLLLLSRRLCEAGCGFVTVHADYAGVWDMHADGNNLDMRDGMQAIGPAFAHAVAALVQDIEQRGLSDRIMVVACGEMGRTPKINSRGGRDHWGRLAPLLMYGGGLPAGRIIGRSTRDGSEPDSDPIHPSHLIATILQSLLDVETLRLVAGIPQPVLDLSQAPPIPGLA